MIEDAASQRSQGCKTQRSTAWQGATGSSCAFDPNYWSDPTGCRRRAKSYRPGPVVWRAAKGLGLCGFL